MNARIGIDGRAAAAMVMLCAIWGMQQVAIKAAEPDVSAVLQIAIRSGLAALAVYLLARGRGERFTWDRATLCAGLSVGALFALEFFLSPQGCVTPAPRIWRCFVHCAAVFRPWPAFSPSSRAPVAGAVAGHAHRLWRRGAGHIGHGRGNGGAERLKGDLYGLLAGIAWGASTLVIRTTRLAECPAKQTLLCQLTGACVLLSLPALATETCISP